MIEDGRIKGVVTTRGTIMADHVVVCAGLWGRLIAEMAGEDLPVMPVDHPLTFFGPYDQFEGTGAEIGWPLLRDQGNSAYMRDTGDPKTAEGGQIEWGYYEEHEPRLVHPRDLLEKEQARLSPSQRDLEMEQVIEPLERAMELTPILGELGYNEEHRSTACCRPPPTAARRWARARRSAASGTRSASGSRTARHGQAHRRLDDRRAHRDRPRRIDYARFNPFQLEEKFIEGAAPRPPARSTTRRCIRASPSPAAAASALAVLRAREGARRLLHGARRLGARARLCGERAPAGEVWQPRPGARERVGQPPLLAVSNAEHLAMSEDCGIINLSHFYICDIEGPTTSR